MVISMKMKTLLNGLNTGLDTKEYLSNTELIIDWNNQLHLSNAIEFLTNFTQKQYCYKSYIEENQTENENSKDDNNNFCFFERIKDTFIQISKIKNKYSLVVMDRRSRDVILDIDLTTHKFVYAWNEWNVKYNRTTDVSKFEHSSKIKQIVVGIESIALSLNKDTNCFLAS